MKKYNTIYTHIYEELYFIIGDLQFKKKTAPIMARDDYKNEKCN